MYPKTLQDSFLLGFLGAEMTRGLLQSTFVEGVEDVTTKCKPTMRSRDGAEWTMGLDWAAELNITKIYISIKI